MRGVLLSVAMLLALVAARPAKAMTLYAVQPAISLSTPTVVAQQVSEPKIDITVQHEDGRGWYRSPMWIAIGVIALVVLILIVAMITRGGGGTTIIRE